MDIFCAFISTPSQACAWVADRLLHDPTHPDAIQNLAVNQRRHQESLYDLPKVIAKYGTMSFDLMTAYFVFFDERIFGGALRDRCRIKFLPRHSDEQIAGYEGHSLLGKDASIFVYELLGGNEVVKLCRYLGTLLHEMAHTFLHFALCQCDMCFGWDISELGYTGHGYIFLKLASLIQDFASNTLQIADISVVGNEDLAREMFTGYLITGNLHQDRPMTRQVGLDPDEVMRDALVRKTKFDERPIEGDDGKVRVLERLMQDFEGLQGFDSVKKCIDDQIKNYRGS